MNTMAEDKPPVIKPKSKFITRPATAADIPGITEVYFDAFGGGLISRRCFPRDSPQSLACWHNSLTAYLEDPNCAVLVVTDPDSDKDPPNDIIAFGKWTGPETQASRDGLRRDELSYGPWPSDGDPELAQRFFQGILGKQKEIMEGRKYWYLHILGVRTEYQGKGASSPMLKWGVERADADGLACYVDASPMGKGVYERYGFREVDRIVFKHDGVELVETMMLREPQGGPEA